MSCDYIFKIIMVGDSFVGKSNLMLQYINDKFSNDHEVTIGVEFGIKNIKFNNYTVKLHIWDTAGQETFRSIVRSYYKQATIVLLVYDITNIDSFYSLHKWLDDIDGMARNPYIILVGNKIDLAPNKRQVSIEMAREFALEHGMNFIETSALNRTNVNDAFFIPTSIIFEKIMNGEIDVTNPAYGINKIGKQSILNNTIDLNNKKSKKSRCCFK